MIHPHIHLYIFQSTQPKTFSFNGEHKKTPASQSLPSLHISQMSLFLCWSDSKKEKKTLTEHIKRHLNPFVDIWCICIFSARPCKTKKYKTWGKDKWEFQFQNISSQFQHFFYLSLCNLATCVTLPKPNDSWERF